MKRRLVMAVTCVPIPPAFLALPLRQIMLPFIGRLPVSSQILAITNFLSKGARETTSEIIGCKDYFCRKWCGVYANRTNFREFKMRSKAQKCLHERKSCNVNRKWKHFTGVWPHPCHQS